MTLTHFWPGLRACPHLAAQAVRGRRLHWPPNPRVWPRPNTSRGRHRVPVIFVHVPQKAGPGYPASLPCITSRNLWKFVVSLLPDKHHCLFRLCYYSEGLSVVTHIVLWPSAVRTGSVTPPSLTSCRPSTGRLRGTLISFSFSANTVKSSKYHGCHMSYRETP